MKFDMAIISSVWFPQAQTLAFTHHTFTDLLSTPSNLLKPASNYLLAETIATASPWCETPLNLSSILHPSPPPLSPPLFPPPPPLSLAPSLPFPPTCLQRSRSHTAPDDPQEAQLETSEPFPSGRKWRCHLEGTAQSGDPKREILSPLCPADSCEGEGRTSEC